MEVKRFEVYKLIEDHYRGNFNSLVKKLRNATGSHHNAEDCVQEAYTRALKYWNTYDGDMGISSWIGGILSNCIRDTQKDQILKGMVQEDVAALSDTPHADGTDVIYLNEIRDRISKFPARIRHVLRLYILEGYSGKEVANLTNYSAEAVRKIVSRFKAEQVANAT